MAHVLITMFSVVVWGDAVVLRDFRENGSQFGGRLEIAQSRRSDAGLVLRNVFVAVFDEAGFP
jgi:hypothetical protein